MKFIIGKKLGMTQIAKDDGRVVPVTQILAGPVVVTQVREEKKDGYTAVQVGYGAKKKVNKPETGHLGQLGPFRVLKEFRVSEKETEKMKPGVEISCNIFEEGDDVSVSGLSKGKGFQGVVKRWGFHGSPASHGHKDQLRMPGSIGATGPAHVFKGQKMPGRMGGGQITVTNLEIVSIDPENNYLFVKGAVPGKTGNLLWISGKGEIDLEKVTGDNVVTSDEVTGDKGQTKKHLDSKSNENDEEKRKIDSNDALSINQPKDNKVKQEEK
jgi:large subunit ribosomal protein L3